MGACGPNPWSWTRHDVDAGQALGAGRAFAGTGGAVRVGQALGAGRGMMKTQEVPYARARPLVLDECAPAQEAPVFGGHWSVQGSLASAGADVDAPLVALRRCSRSRGRGCGWGRWRLRP